MRGAFTLMELLVVVAIMGLLGTASVGGYRQMQRGMEERGVMQNVNQFIRAAYQRAQIDRQPTAVYCWNETLRAATMDENEVVVGKAVAVRRKGRITKVKSGLLIDEFGDLDLTFPVGTGSEDEESGKGANSSSSKSATMRLYQLDSPSEGLKCSIVRDKVESTTMSEFYLAGNNPIYDNLDNVGKGKLTLYGFRVEEAGDANWKVGSAYGFEFATIELPHGYIFGSSYSSSIENPVREADTLVFKAGNASSSGKGGTVGASTVTIYSLRPNTSGSLTAQKIGTSDAPTTSISDN